MGKERNEAEDEGQDPDLEFSALGGLVTRDERTVQVHIYRTVGSTAGWALEVVDVDDTSTVWDTLFATERDAYAEFSRALEEDGIQAFLGAPAGRDMQ